MIRLAADENFAGPITEGLLRRNPAIDLVRDLPQVVVSDEAHAAEHSLEVQLPFLQRIAPNARLVPFAVGDVHPRAVAQVLERFWNDPGTIIVISSDLSHYLPYDAARNVDLATAEMIEQLKGAGYDPVPIDTSELRKAGGSVKGCTLELRGDNQ